MSFTNANRFLKFCIVGGTGIFINTVALFTLSEFIGFPLLISGMFAIFIAMTWNFCLNNIWTFRERKTENTLAIRYLSFVLFCSLGGIINACLLIILTNAGMYYLIANLIGIAAGTASNYLLNEKITWAQSHKS